MKYYFLLWVTSLIVVLTGCTQPTQPNTTENNNVELANPASTFCIEQGGALELSGSTGYCVLQNGNGQQYEEWEFYRNNYIETDSDIYIWLSVEEAEAEASKRGVPFRVIELDGESLPRHDDLRRWRVNAIVIDDVVSDVVIEDNNTII